MNGGWEASGICGEGLYVFDSYEKHPPPASVLYPTFSSQQYKHINNRQFLKHYPQYKFNTVLKT